MSSLQIGLAIAGGVVLVGVVAHGTWTSRKNKPRQAEPLPESSSVTDPSDVVAIQEPTFHEPTVQEPSWQLPAQHDEALVAPPAVAEVVDKSLDPVSDLARSVMAQATQHAQRIPDEAELARLAQERERQQAAAQEAARKAKADAALQHEAGVLLQPEKRPSLDALIDVLAAIEVDAPISGEATLAAMPTTRRVGTKFFTLEGLNAASGLWEQPRAGQWYSAFQAGVQLANRMGALNEIEFSEFVLKTQTFADAINGAPEFSDMIHEVARARELDHFASGHDAQLSFTLVATQSAWSPGYVHQNAARLGFVAGAIPGRMVLPGAVAGQPPILVLEFDSQAALAEDPAQSAIREIHLSLDVPQVEPKEEPFARMVQTAHELARVMDGAVTDDNGQPLSEAAIGAIARDLQNLYATLDARDLSAGSPQARRLFS
jgi:FtsZ-interacting cell division protein ZipA